MRKQENTKLIQTPSFLALATGNFNEVINNQAVDSTAIAERRPMNMRRKSNGTRRRSIISYIYRKELVQEYCGTRIWTYYCIVFCVGQVCRCTTVKLVEPVCIVECSWNAHDTTFATPAVLLKYITYLSAASAAFN